MYKWGDKTRRGYMAESNELEQALRLLPRTDRDEAVTRLAEFLQDVASVWGGEVTQRHRNKLAKAFLESA